MITIRFKDVEGATHGVYLAEAPVIRTAEKRVTFVDVPGIDGQLACEDGGYNDVEMELNAYIQDVSNLENALGWLHGSGDMVFSSDATHCVKARIIDNVQVEQVARSIAARILKIQIRMKPFRYLANPSDVTVNASGTKISNPGTAPSKPLIRINGTGSGTLMIGRGTMLFTDISEYVDIDCESKICYKGTALETSKISGEWIEIPAGTTHVTWTGDATSVQITPRWRWY